jgi:type IV/VI secretion system ImpK/VasF family protein
MTPSPLRAFQPLFEILNALVLGQQVKSAADLVPLRADLRRRLLALKSELTTRLNEREVYLTLFALVVHLDEIVRTSFPEADRGTWPLLQQELFDTDRGGELFYQSLDELLETQKLRPVVYQVYYFCLSLGFRGKYAHEPEKRSQLVRKLRDTLVASLHAGQKTLERPAVALPARLPRIHSRAWPWAGAAVVLLAVFVWLSVLARAQESRWRNSWPALEGRGRQAAGPCAAEDEPCRSS